MTFYYFNDKDIAVRVAVGTLDKQTVVLPQRMQKFEIDLPKDCCLFIKEWVDNLIFVSFVNKKVEVRNAT